MSGGSFNYLVFKDVGEMFEQISTLKQMEEFLRGQERHLVANELFKYRLELETAYHRLSIMHNRLSGVMKATEWYASSDWGIESVDRAYEELAGIAKEDTE